MISDLTAFPNWHTFGHDWAVDYLRKSILHGRNRHAYLFVGAPNVGKDTLAHAFAQALNCTHEDVEMRPCGDCRSCKLLISGNHPDMIYAETDERTGALKIDAVREVSKLLALKPFASRYRVAIFRDFDRARGQAQDALLKTLEEPSPHSILLLQATSTDNVLSTITSRCQIINLRPASLDHTSQVLQHYGADEDQATLIGRLSGGRIGWALEAMKDSSILEGRETILNMLNDALRGNRAKRFSIAEDLGKLDKNDVRYALEMWQTYWRDMLLLAENSPVKPCNTDRRVEMQQLLMNIQPNEALKALQVTRTMLSKTLSTNANVRLALEAMMLDYPNLEVR